MSLKKTIAGHFAKDGSWIEQRDVVMHPLEEAATLSDWAAHNAKSKMPVEPTQLEEHEWLIQYGSVYVRQKREEWKTAHDSMLPSLITHENAFQQAHNNWNQHVELCAKHGHDPDTYPGDARLSLK